MKARYILTYLMFFVCINISITAYAQAVNVQDSLALVDLYNSTDGPNWTNNTNWLTGPVNTWYGIEVTDGRVTSIAMNNFFMKGNNLTGNIPASLGTLSSLLSLNLSSNKLKGSFPFELGNLLNLTYLNLGSNKLTGAIPLELGNLINLTYLNFSDNRLIGSIPAFLGNLTNLNSLYLANNQLSGSIPPELGNLSNLVSMNFKVNQLSGTIPVDLGDLVNLSNLDLSDNKLTGSIPSELGKLNFLVALYIDHNELSGIIPAEFGKLNFSALHLDFNKLTGSIPPDLHSTVQLKLDHNLLSGVIPPSLGVVGLNELDLSYNQLSGSIPPELGNIGGGSNRDGGYLNLSYNRLSGSIPTELGIRLIGGLNLSNNQLSGSIPPELGDIGSGTYSRRGNLDLSHNQLIGSIPPELGRSSIWKLNLSHNQLTGNISPELVTSYIGRAGILDLDLSYNHLTGNIPSVRSTWHKHMRTLHLNNNELSGEIPSTFGKFTSITELWLQNNKLNGSIPARFGDIQNKNCQINLSDNYFTFEGMERVATEFPNALYAPQANIPLQQNSGSLYVSAGGRVNKNTYNWFEADNPNPTIIAGDSVFHPSSSGKYFATITNSICTQLTLYTDTIYYDATLPVTLINLQAQQQGGVVKVDWTSVTEINVDKYEIQRASNAQNFVGIGSMPATGNGTLSINYFFNDVKPLQGNNYYRLKAFDKDGAITYSNMVLVKMNSDKIVTLIYPNPAKNILNIQTNGSASFSLLNQNGKAMITKAINNSGSLDISNFAAGIYYLKNNMNDEVKKVFIER